MHALAQYRQQEDIQTNSRLQISKGDKLRTQPVKGDLHTLFVNTLRATDVEPRMKHKVDSTNKLHVDEMALLWPACSLSKIF